MVKEFLVGSRKLQINNIDSDYDKVRCIINSSNEHFMEIKKWDVGTEEVKWDIHTYIYENKEKLIDHYYKNCSNFSLPSLIYEEFRNFWNISLEEAKIIIDDMGKRGVYLRSYELYYFNCQYEDKKVNKVVLKALYETYKESLKDK